MPVTVTCEHCAEDFTVEFPSHAKKRRFCSQACSQDHQRGENHYNWQGGEVEVACEECGVVVERRKDQVAKHEHSFCSVECRGRFMGRTMRGENASRYNPDKMVTLTCGNCGVEFEREDWRANRGQSTHYCSRECRQANMSGENHPNWQGGRVEVKCAECGETVLRDPFQAAEDKDRFCDVHCRAQFLSRTTHGEKSPHWRGGPAELTCDECGDTFFREKSSVPDGLCFCSYKCMGAYRKRTYQGEDHPCWKGGRNGYYGANWRDQRNAARERDGYHCQVCGVPEEDLDRELSVHHIKPFRECSSWREANQLGNLICLCGSCHQTHEHDPDFCETARLRIAHAESAAQTDDTCAEVPSQPSLLSAD